MLVIALSRARILAIQEFAISRRPEDMHAHTSGRKAWHVEDRSRAQVPWLLSSQRLQRRNSLRWELRRCRGTFGSVEPEHIVNNFHRSCTTASKRLRVDMVSRVEQSHREIVVLLTD